MTKAERVAKGVAVLDRERPSWREELNVEILDVGSTETCPLAQLYGRFSDGAAELSGSETTWDVGVWAAEHGFELADEEHDVDYRALTALWLSELGVR